MYQLRLWLVFTEIARGGNLRLVNETQPGFVLAFTRRWSAFRTQPLACLRWDHMKRFVVLHIPWVLLLSACLATPPPELLVTRTLHQSIAPAEMAIQDADPSATPSMVEIEGRTISVDKVVQGMLCDDEWRGTIYVTEDIQVNPWVDEPTFLRECSLVVDPGTIVYVAAHPAEVFYRGCTCHE